MAGAAENLMSLDEFLAWEREQPERYEFADGVVRMMTGASLAHVTITMNIASALRHALRGTGCRPFASDAKLIAAGSVRYPDIAVTCRPVNDADDIVPDPILIIEVISPSTARIDRGRKKIDYFATPSLQQYAIIEQDERLIDLYTRRESGWVNEVIADGMTLHLTAIGVAISLDAIYEDTELAVTRQQGDARPPPAA